MSKASIYYDVSNINGKHSIKELKQEIDGLSGVISVTVNNKNKNIAVDFDTTGVNHSRIKKKIQDLGYTVTGARFDNHIM